LATTAADAIGSYQVVVVIPRETTAGQHTIVVSGPGGQPRAEAAVTVVRPPVNLLAVLLSLFGLLG
jgi:phosphatidate phosphatase APP1